MQFKEGLQSLFEPRAVKEAREIEEVDKAREREGQATGAYLRGEISLDAYQELLKETYPITKLDLRKLAGELQRQQFINTVDGAAEKLAELGHRVQEVFSGKKASA